MKKYYIGFPQKEGCHVNGADLGIDVISKNFKIDEIINIEKKDTDIETVSVSCENLARIVDNAIKEENIPVTIGGDHSLAIGSIAGSSKNYDNLGLLWIDSHTDINTNLTTTTYNIHGYPVAVSMGEGLKELVNCFYNGTKVKYENIVIFGANDIDEEEKEIIKKFNIKLFTYDEIKKEGLEVSLKKAFDYLKSKTDNMHVSIDIDCLNPYLSPGVNVPSHFDKGFNFDELTKIVEECLSKLNIVSMDVVEYNPLADKNNLTRDIFLKILNIIKNS